MSDNYRPDYEMFLRDVSAHKMTGHVLDGVYRHLTFRRPDTSAYYFDITTWPGYLTISGDMGCFVFARLNDMFEFFRHDNINPSYWAEKLQATSKGSGHREFSGTLFTEALKEDFEGWDFESEEQKAEAWADIADDSLGLFQHSGCRDLNHAVRETMDWKCRVTGQKFQEFYEHTLEDYTYHFIWCCRAIRWAIAQFDAARSSTEAAHG